MFLIAKQTGNGQLVAWNNGVDIGHVTSAIVPVIRTRTNGIVTNSQYVTDTNQITTYSYWPDSSTPGLPNSCARKNCANDKNFVLDVLSKGVDSGTASDGSKFAIRKQKLHPSSLAVIETKAYSATNCTSYAYCTCVDQATRLWMFVTSEDVFIPNPNSITSSSPNAVYNKIINANNSLGVYANNGIYGIVQ